MAIVSIILPVYNAEQTLNRCLDALLIQTFQDFEVICVNDGSTDNSWQILEEYSQKDNRIKIYNQENHGVAYTRHFAMSKMNGKYMMSCDADDWYEPDTVEQMVRTIEEQKVDFVMCDVDVIDIANGSIQNNKDINYTKLKEIGFHKITPKSIKKLNVVLWNKIFKTDFIKKNDIIYPTQYEHDDMAFAYKYFIAADSYFGLNKKLYHYVVGNKDSIMGQCITNKNKGKEYDFVYAFDDIFKFLQLHPNKNYKYFIEDKMISYFGCYKKYLELYKQFKAYKILRQYILEAGNISNNNERVRFIKKSASYNDYVNQFKKKKVTFLQQLFSMKNENYYKIIRILGFKISFELKKEANTKIFFVYKEPANLLKNEICIPIQSGRTTLTKGTIENLSDNEKQWMLNNTLGDNTGNNISYLNDCLKDMTSIYWVWKNYKEIGAPGIIGFMNNNSILNLQSSHNSTNYLDNYGYDISVIKNILENTKAITGFWSKSNDSPYETYKSNNDVLFYDKLLKIIETRYSHEYKNFYKWSIGSRNCTLLKNTFIMRKKEFFEYCNWIFPILFDLILEIENCDFENLNKKETIALLSEVLTAYYFEKYIKEKNCKQYASIKQNNDIYTGTNNEQTIATILKTGV